MRIGIVLARPPAYSETFFRAKIIGLQKKGFQVVLFCQEGNRDFNLCPVYTTPIRSKNPLIQFLYFLYVYVTLIGSIRSAARFFNLERKEGNSIQVIFKKLYLNAHLLKARVDWLHFGFATIALERECIAEAIGAKMAVSFRGFDIDVYPLKNPGCYDLLWEKLDKVHSISEYLLQKAYRLGLPKDMSYSVIHPAVDLDRLPGATFNNISPNSTFKIVTVARLHWIKGIDLLITTAENLRQKGVDFEWLIIGSGEKKEEERYRYHVYEISLDEHIRFVGALSHDESLNKINKADLYVQTSLSEGFCNALLEAQALGKTCIAFAVGGVPENIKDGRTGWLINPFSTGELTSKIEEVLKRTPEEKLEMSLSAIQRVKESFSAERQSISFKNFYE